MSKVPQARDWDKDPPTAEEKKAAWKAWGDAGGWGHLHPAFYELPPRLPDSEEIRQQDELAAQYPDEFLVFVGAELTGHTTDEDEAHRFLDQAWASDPAVHPVLRRPRTGPRRQFPPVTRHRTV